MSEETLGQMIRRIRREHKMTQQELARRVLVKDTYISKIEVGTQRGSYEVLANISSVLGIPWDNIRHLAGLKIPNMYGKDEPMYTELDKHFATLHPRVKFALYEIAPIIEKWIVPAP